MVSTKQDEELMLLHPCTEANVSNHLRRRWSRVLATASAFLALSCLMVLLSASARFPSEARRNIETSSIDQLLREVPLIDGHNDFPIWFRAFYKNRINNLTEDETLLGQVDFPRLRKSRLGGQFWSVYVLCPEDPLDFSDAAYNTSVHDTLQQIDLVHRLVARFPQRLHLASSAAEIRAAHRTSPDRITGVLAAEGLHQIGNSVSSLRLYYSLGMRSASLTHDCHNRFADAAQAGSPVHGGLSHAGEAIVREMNRMGMIVDLAHASADTMRQVLNISAAPVIFSHSNAYSVLPHPRNVPDDVLLQVKENGGVVMVTFYPEYLAMDHKAASVQDFVDHVEYIGEFIGWDHVGIGSDFDGMPSGPEGLEDVSKYMDILELLARRGVSMTKLRGLVGDNILRVLEAVEQVATRSAMLPLEDDVESLF